MAVNRVPDIDAISQPSVGAVPHGQPVMSREQLEAIVEATEASQEVFNVRAAWNVIQRHKLGLVVLTVVGALLGYWYAGTKVPLYRSSATIIIGPEEKNLISGDSANYYYYSFRYLETQHDIIKSARVARIAATRLTPDQKGLFDQTTEPGAVDRVLAMAKAGILGLFDTGVDQEPATERRGAETATQTDPADAELRRYATLIRGGLEVSPGGDSETVAISYTSHSPELAGLVPDLVASAYIEYGIESRAERSARAGQWLGERLLELREKLTASETALREFQIREGVVDTESFRELTTSRLEQLNEAVGQAQQQVSELSKRYGPKHPSMIAAQRELDETKRRLETESRQVVTSSAKQFELVKLENEVKSNREMYELFRNRFNEADVTTDASLANASVLDPAMEPAAPFSPNVSRFSTMGGVFGAILAIALAFLREKLDTTIRTHDQLEDKTGLSVLGVVPLVTESDKRLTKRLARRHRVSTKGGVVPERYYFQSPKSSFTEAVNHVRTSILYSHVGQAPRVIMVTSAVQGEGKTTIASNLAQAFSQLDKTLLLDADMRKPRVAQAAGLKRAAGLVEVLVGRASLEDTIVTDQAEAHLDILRCGMIPPNPLELLSSDQMRKLLGELKERYRYIVVDSAPVLPVSDAMVMSRNVDGVVVVVKSNSTSHVAVRDALRRLASVQSPLLGTVLAQIDQRRAHYYYGRNHYYSQYYYSYGYGPK